jgi:hypothetical protein
MIRAHEAVVLRPPDDDTVEKVRESQADGVEVSYLTPLSEYLTLTTGMYNKIGAENERVSNLIARNFSQFTYLGRAATFLNLTDANSIDLGLSYAYTPKVKIEQNGNRQLAGIDLTYRYTPLSQSSYRGLIWGTEVLYNTERRPNGGFPEAGMESTEPLQFTRHDALGMYSYEEPTSCLLSRIPLPVLSKPDSARGATALSPYLRGRGFQRIRLQYQRLEEPGNHKQFFVWTVILGSHVHGFRDR